MYSKFAHEFSKTRTRPWRCVETFLKTHSPSTLLDAGCCNGRNIIAALQAGYDAEGFDICPEFVDICLDRNLKAYVGNIESALNPITKMYDYIICIAMLHHLKTHDARMQALQRMFDGLHADGSMLITVWSYESEGARFPKSFVCGDNNVPWKSLHSTSVSDRYYYIYDRTDLNTFLSEFQHKNSNASISIEWEEQNWIININKSKV
jgi:SAM-dependent methyltransferase